MDRSTASLRCQDFRHAQTGNGLIAITSAHTQRESFRVRRTGPLSASRCAKSCSLIGSESMRTLPPGRIHATLQKSRLRPSSKHRIHADAVALLHDIGEVDRLVIREDQLDFGMRHAKRLDRMLHRRAAGAHASEGAFPSSKRKKVAQLFVT